MTAIATTQMVYRVLFSSGRCAVTLVYVVLGTNFGFILSRSGAADYGFGRGRFGIRKLGRHGA